MTKDYILSEIRRTANENDGEALGWRRFESETGIGWGDWCKFWARWSEAVREAGVAPNNFTAPFEDSALLEHLASLARKLGKLPAWSDIRLQKHRDPSFPNAKVFRRLGSKEEVVARIAAFCKSKSGWDDVLALCDAHAVANTRDAALEQTGSYEEVDFGFVYLLRSGRFFKIGRSNSVGRREYELAIQLPEPVTQVHKIRTDDPPGIDAYWHNRFASKRKNGEWFELNAADVRAFKRRKLM